jgi:EAL domain-containing protein (putative c-di-GMP-specific phosphodiesterase class I)
VAERFELENELRRALGRGGEFEMFYQPIIRLATGRLAGFEALMRWKHPVNGLVSPARFIPIAEDSDMIVQLGNIALEQSVARLADWNLAFARDRPLFLSINVSGRQFVSDELSWMIGKLLAEHQVDPKLIKLEITESILMDDPAHTFDMLQALKEQDIKLSIDDFGTGYSSLSYLSRFPVDTLKISHVSAPWVRNPRTRRSCARSRRWRIHLASTLSPKASSAKPTAPVSSTLVASSAKAGYSAGRSTPTRRARFCHGSVPISGWSGGCCRWQPGSLHPGQPGSVDQT